jgi:outer membrane receptor for ferrienterochelin and colicins
MRKIYISFLLAIVSQSVFAQLDTLKTLGEVVITGQYKPQSVKNSVYQVRVINSERIRQSGATEIKQVLANQLGFRFSNDNTIGTTDVQLMGMSGRNVKILLDGVPMVDRGDTRESLNQVDVNTIERIEIVEGPMSVSYGSDALAGVINIITKKNEKNNLTVSAKLQEETAGSEYYPFSYKGAHLQNVNIGWNKNSWNFSVGGTHNDQDGFGGDAYGRNKQWKPKEQWLGHTRMGYENRRFNIYYRLDALQENIISRGAINMNTYKAVDQRYATDRFTHQLQGGWKINSKMQLNGLMAYTDYERRTNTTRHDFEKGTDELTTGLGEQDISKFNSFVYRTTLQYTVAPAFSLQPGIDINRESASGERIEGKPVITDFAAFVSAEIKPNSKINLRPGLRFIHNSVYDAPPVVPSFNAKLILSKTLDLRLAYAYGFRSPALRELYFSFHDVNHDIEGNKNLKAEHSNSFSASLGWTPVKSTGLKYSSTLTGFYNVFNNQIDLALSTTNANLYTYFNINQSKTTGATLNNTLGWKNLSANLGFSYIGYYASVFNDPVYTKADNRDFLWTPEINSNISYNITKLKTKLGLFYKFTGKRPSFVFGEDASGNGIVYVANVTSYHLADFTITSQVHPMITLCGGVKNIFDVTRISNTATGGGMHAVNGAVPISYGRSFFLGLHFQWNKKYK